MMGAGAGAARGRTGLPGRGRARGAQHRMARPLVRAAGLRAGGRAAQAAAAAAAAAALRGRAGGRVLQLIVGQRPGLLRLAAQANARVRQHLVLRRDGHLRARGAPA